MQNGSLAALYGQPQILQFWGGANAAFSLQLDDSMTSQVKNALPLLDERKLHATFFVNAGTPHYAANRRIWEGKVLSAGHELGNHTFTHKGARNVEEAQNEISKCATVISAAYHNRPHLTPFMIPGGVPWEIKHDALTLFLEKYDTYLAPRSGILMDSTAGQGESDPTALPQKALRDRSWTQLGMHGVGGEWLSTNIPTFTRLLDFLVANRATLWTAPTSAVYQYEAQRDAARPVALTDISERGFSVTVICDATRIKTFGVPFSALYTQPLTVRVSVPADFRKFTLQQGTRSERYKTIPENGERFAQFNLLPNRGVARISRE